MIPKIIWTAWFGDVMPETVKKSIKSQSIPGYQLFVLNEKNFQDDSFTKMYGVPQYVKTALENKKWVKATDYLRAWVLYTYGGIFLDADQEILPGKNFDDLLDKKLFASAEENGFIGYSLVGSEANHPIWEEYFKEVNEKFTPLDGKNFESSMEIFTKLIYNRRGGPEDGTILTPDYFFPYNHQTGIINVTDNTRTFHHFMKSWTDISPDLLPTVTFVIPQLGREEGLKKCLDSIDRLYYPKHLVEIIVEEGPDTVPVKVHRAYGKSRGDIIVYAANDTEFGPESLYLAVQASKEHALVAFNEGPVLSDEGNICTHFAVRRDLVQKLERGEIFSTDFNHVGCDNWLWAQAKKLNEAFYCEGAIIKHSHFSKPGELGVPSDWVYEKGWSQTEKDRETLREKLLLLK